MKTKGRKKSTTKRAAIHSPSSFTDGEAINLVKYLLNHHRLVKPDLKENDTWPNIDGYLEIVKTSGEPDGKLEAQVKRLQPERITQKISFYFDDDSKFFTYCENINPLPVLFICVDLQTKKAYWIEMTPEVIKSSNGRTIYIPPENIIDENNKDYAKNWKEICDKRKKLIEEANKNQRELIKQLVSSKPDSTLLKKNETAINNILDDIKNKILIYEGLLFFISPAFINDSKTRELVRKRIRISQQQEELFIDELTKQAILSRTGDVVVFDDDNLGREKLSYLIGNGNISVQETYEYFEDKKLRKQMLKKIAEIIERDEIDKFFEFLATDLYDFISKAESNDDIDINLDLLEEYAFRVPEITVKIVKRIVSDERKLQPKTYKSDWGDIKGLSHEGLLKRVIELLGKVRYLETKDTLSLLLLLSKMPNGDIKKKALEGIKSLSQYNLFALRNIGFRTQSMILYEVEGLEASALANNFDGVLELGRELLKPSFEGSHMSDYKTFTFSFGALKVSDEIKKTRKRTIEILKKLYSEISKTDKKIKVLQTLEESSRTPSQGAYGDEVVDMVLLDTNGLIEYYLPLVKQSDGEIVKEIEEQAHWFIRRFTKEKLPKIELLEKELSENNEFQIFRVFFGYDLRYDEKLGWAEAQAEREKKIQEFVDEVTQTNIQLWEKRIIDSVKNYSNQEHGKYQHFSLFLNKLGAQKPEIAMQIINKTQADIQPFLVNIISGIWESQKNELAKGLINQWITENKNLGVCAAVFFYIEDIDIDILIKIFNKAKSIEDYETITLLVRLITNKFNGDIKLKKMFLEGVTLLTSKKITKWTFFPLRKIKELLNSLSDMEVNIVLNSLVYEQRIDHDTEEILLPIAEKSPSKIVSFFKMRIAYRIKQGKESSYDAVPFDFYELGDILSKQAEIVVPSILEWFSEADGYYKWEASQLLQEVFKSFGQNLEQALLSMIRSGDKNKAEMVLLILQSYKGETFLHTVSKEFIKKYMRNQSSDSYKKYHGDMFIILSQTGVVMGEFGLRDAYVRKKEEIQSWKRERSKSIQGFVKDYEDYLDKQIAFEQKRSETDIELMKKGVI